MLAYVFWHWRQSNIERNTYLNHLIDFHRTLAANKSIGFQRSVVFSIQNAPWLDTDGEAFEEWYLLDNSAAMDKLNDGAVSGNCERPHNLVAREAAGGTGGLYRLREGSARLSDAKYAIWFSKPGGVTYPEFYSGLKGITSRPGNALWGRQMTLGPTAEFCLHAQNEKELPADNEGLALTLSLIWSGQ